MIKSEIKKINKKINHRFHMPGHKGRGECFNFYEYDITEIPGADNLHDAHGVIAEAQKKVARIYNSEEAAILVNGTTTGIHSAILGACAPGQKLLVPINCHRAVFGALALGRIEGVFIVPEIQKEMGFAHAISLESIEKALRENPEIAGMILTNPTYYGTTSDVNKIAKILHQKGKFLIVDEAHGAHLKFNDKLPMDAIEAGADVVIQSTHKILGSFTQSSLIHFQGDLVNRQGIKSFLGLLQSSSPSYPLMISVEEAVDAAYEDGEAIFAGIIKAHIDYCLKQNVNVPIALYDGGELDRDYDRSKWLFQTRGLSGDQLETLLSNRYGIQCEMSGPNHVLAMTGMGTTIADLERLTQAIDDINEMIFQNEIQKKTPKTATAFWEEMDFKESVKTEIPLWEALYADRKEKKSIDKAAGQISGDFIIPYPPGIPALLPGSRISHKMLVYLNHLLEHGVAVVGIDGNRELWLLKEETDNHA